MNALAKLLGLTALLLMSHASNARAEGCEFVRRDQMESLLKAMPKEVVGYVNCFEKSPKVNMLFVAKFKHLDDGALDLFVGRVGLSVDAGSRSIASVWHSKGPIAKRQILLKTLTPKNQYTTSKSLMSHYGFVEPTKDGGYILFLHSQGERETQLNRHTLESVRKQISRPEFLAKLG